MGRTKPMDFLKSHRPGQLLVRSSACLSATTVPAQLLCVVGLCSSLASTADSDGRGTEAGILRAGRLGLSSASPAHLVS